MVMNEHKPAPFHAASIYSEKLEEDALGDGDH